MTEYYTNVILIKMIIILEYNRSQLKSPAGCARALYC